MFARKKNHDLSLSFKNLFVFSSSILVIFFPFNRLFSSFSLHYFNTNFHDFIFYPIIIFTSASAFNKLASRTWKTFLEVSESIWFERVEMDSDATGASLVFLILWNLRHRIRFS